MPAKNAGKMETISQWRQRFWCIANNLSKAFDCLDHELLKAKLNAYSFSLPVLRLINDYLSNRRQRTRIGNSFSEWFEVILGVPKGSRY